MERLPAEWSVRYPSATVSPQSLCCNWDTAVFMRYGWAASVIFAPGFLNTLPWLCSLQLKKALDALLNNCKQQVKYRKNVVGIVLRVIKWLSHKRKVTAERSKTCHGEGSRTEAEGQLYSLSLFSEGVLAYMSVSSH